MIGFYVLGLLLSSVLCFLMSRRPPRFTRSVILFPCTSLFRSGDELHNGIDRTQSGEVVRLARPALATRRQRGARSAAAARVASLACLVTVGSRRQQGGQRQRAGADVGSQEIGRAHV